MAGDQHTRNVAKAAQGYAEALRRIKAARKNAGKLDLSKLGLTEVPTELWELKALEGLDLSNNRLAAMPKELGELKALRDLDLKYNQLTAVPKELGELKALTLLDLRNNQLTAVPKELGGLKALTGLFLSNNQLTAVPKELGELKALTGLDLGNNQLIAVPKELGGLKALTVLALSNNQLAAVPKELGELKALMDLWLYSNQLTTVPKELGQMTALTKLALFNNQLTTVPKELGELKALTNLSLGINQLTELPKELGQLKALEVLDLNHNQLTAAPKELWELKALTKLDLSNNQLTAVPKELGELKALTDLGLSDNKLTALPKELGELEVLTRLFLHNNPALGLPPEVLGPTLGECEDKGLNKNPAKPADILAYYFWLQEGAGADATRRLNECKLLLVGQGGVGKTSLVNRLIRGTFNDTEEKTEGIGREPWPIPSPHDGEQITLNVWDFGGQEIMHATHQFFLTKRSVYLVVFDARKGENEGNIHYWLGSIRAFGDDSPVIVVTNKCEPPNDLNLNETRLRLDYPNIKAFVKTSCLTKRGIPELRELIEQQVRAMGHVFNKLPSGWWKVKRELAELATKDKYVEEKDYCAIADRHGVKQPAQRSLLLRLLHDLGTVLNYNDEDDRYHLNDTHILDPQWVTRGVYRLLNENQLFHSHGVLKLRDLKRHLREADGYNEDGREFIIGMMKKFQLCFDHSINGEPGVLIPELLLKDEPTLPWGEAGTLAFEYHYEVLPAGVIPRFIVLSHAKHAKGGSCWRSGVVLEDEGCRVLVRGDTQAGKVYIHVQPLSKGAVRNRRLALKMVRNCFDQIHQNLAARAMVPLPDDPTADPIKYEYLCQLEREEGPEYSWKPDGASRKYTVRELLDGTETPEDRRRARIAAEEPARVALARALKDRQLPPVPPPKQETWWKPLLAPLITATAAALLAVLVRADWSGWGTMIYAVFALAFAAVLIMRYRHEWRTTHRARFAMFVFTTLASGGLLASAFGIEGKWEIAPGLRINVNTTISWIVTWVGLVGAGAFGIIQYKLDRSGTKAREVRR